MKIFFIILISALLGLSIYLYLNKQTISPEKQILGMWKLEEAEIYNNGTNEVEKFNNLYINFNDKSDAVFYSSDSIFKVISYYIDTANQKLNGLSIHPDIDYQADLKLSSPKEILFIEDDGEDVTDGRDFDVLSISDKILTLQYKSLLPHVYVIFHFKKSQQTK